MSPIPVHGLRAGDRWVASPDHGEIALRGARYDLCVAAPRRSGRPDCIPPGNDFGSGNGGDSSVFVDHYRWCDAGGEVSATTIEFNTATSRHFARFVSLIRPAPDPLAGIALDAEQAKFNYLTAESFKFGSFACSSLIEGEQVHQIVWQPKIRKPLTRLGKFTFYQTLALPHVAVLTDKEFIVIQDDERTRENRGVRYGGKWRYIALKHIVRLHCRLKAMSR